MFLCGLILRKICFYVVTILASLRQMSYTKYGNKDEQIIIKRILEGETAMFSQFRGAIQPFGFINDCSHVSRARMRRIIAGCISEGVQQTRNFQGGLFRFLLAFRFAYNTAISFSRKKKVILPAIDESIIETVSDEAVGTFFDEDEMNAGSAARNCHCAAKCRRKSIDSRCFIWNRSR